MLADAKTVIVGLTLTELAKRMDLQNGLQLHGLFLGRAVGAVFGSIPRATELQRAPIHRPPSRGTMLGGWLCDVCPIKIAMCCCIGGLP